MAGTQERVGEMSARFGSWYRDRAEHDRGRMTALLYPYDSLFSPIRVNRLEIKNRIVLAPMGNFSMAEETGRPSTRMVEYFAARAAGGAGLLTSGLVPVSHGIDPAVTEPEGLSYFPRIDRSRTNFAGWREIAARCREHGARFFLQLTPGLGRVGSPECLVTKRRLPVSASWNPNFYMPLVPCRPLTDGELRRIVRRTGQAAADAKAAGIDGVYLHGHEGYLLEQLSNRAFNRRKLGAFADWTAFGTALVREIRRRTGDDYPILYRIDLTLALAETYGDRMRTVPRLRRFAGERSADETLEYLEALVAAGVDLVDVDLGCYDNWWLPHPPGPMPPACYLDAARIVKERFAERNVRSNAGLPVPVVAVGKLGFPDLAEAALRDGSCDMVMLGRPLLADPEWPNKAFAGRVDRIRPCIGDQEGCLGELVEGGRPGCAVNPRTGLEDRLDGSELAPARDPGRVAVVGAGPAGITAALAAARRGHSVTLFEARAEIGGMLVPGSRPAIKYEVANYLDWLRGEVERARAGGNLSLELGRAPTAPELKAAGFDAIVTATGSRQVRPGIPGIDGARVVAAVDLLREPDLSGGARRAVVVGGGTVGCETALWLSRELGLAEVALVEMLPWLMKGVCTANRGWLIHFLEEAGVRLLNCASLAEVRDGEVRVIRNVSRTVPDPRVTWEPLLPENVPNPYSRRIRVQEREETLGADLVVLAAGAKADDGLYRHCVTVGAAPLVRNVGDSHAPGRVLEAVRSGYSAGISV
jgi:2-enoate reductase